MMMGPEGTCWEERIHKEEDALQDFMEEWDTGLPNDIAQMEERQRQEAQSRAETAQSRLSDFAAQQKPENAQGRLSRVRWPPRSIARAGSAPFRAAAPPAKDRQQHHSAASSAAFGPARTPRPPWHAGGLCLALPRPEAGLCAARPLLRVDPTMALPSSPPRPPCPCHHRSPAITARPWVKCEITDYSDVGGRSS